MGISHTAKFENKYFSTTLPIWVDEFLTDPKSSIDQYEAWADSFCSDDEDVRMVRDSLFAVIYTFDPSQDIDQLHKGENADLNGKLKRQAKNILRFLEKLDNESWDGLCLAVAKGNLNKKNKISQSSERSSLKDELAIIFDEYGVDIIDLLDSGLVKEGEKQGFEALKENLETHIALTGNFEPVYESSNENIETDSKNYDSTILDDKIRDMGFSVPFLDQTGPIDTEGETFDPESMNELIEKIKNARSK